MQMTDIQKLPLSVSGVDADGNPTGAVPGLTFAVSPFAGGTVAAAAGDTTGTLFEFTPSSSPGNLGDVQIAVSAPDPADATKTLTGALTVTVVASATHSLSVTPGTPA